MKTVSKFFLSMLVLVAFLTDTMAQKQPVMLNNQLKIQLKTSFLNNRSMKFIINDLSAKGYKEGDDDDFFNLVLQNEKGETIEATMQGFTNENTKEFAIAGTIKRDGKEYHSIITGKEGDNYGELKEQMLKVRANNFSFEKVKGGPSAFDENIDDEFYFESTPPANAKLVQFLGCLISQVASDCSNRCDLNAVKRCISSKKGAFKAALNAIWNSDSWRITKVTKSGWEAVKFGGRVATCLAGGACGTCVGYQIPDCIGAF